MENNCRHHFNAIRIFCVTFLIPVIISFKTTDLEISTGNRFVFTHMFINDNLPTVNRNGVQTLADYDNDGDLDMTIGSLDHSLYLMKNNGTNWSAMWIGNLPYTALGAQAIDVNNDGWLDLIAAGVWYENILGTSFAMHYYDSRFKSGDHFHDIVAADINNDGKKDIVGMGDDIGFFWYELWSDPMGQWKRTTIDPSYPDWNDHVHGGFSPAGFGDLDGDGDNDIFRADAWFENKNNGETWTKHPVTFSELFTGKLPYGKATRSVVIDIDHDGDNDIVFTTCDDVDGKAGIMENIQGDGSEWALILFPQNAPGRRGSLHSLQVIDLDGDGELDVITADQEDMIEAGMPSPRWYVFYQSDSGWEEEVFFDKGLGSHELLAGDVDQDGDLDLVGKNWYPWFGNAVNGASHADYFENHLIDQTYNALRLSANVNNGWIQTGGKWEQLGGQIIGSQNLDGANSGGLLLSVQKFGDCEVVCDVWPDYGIDSGIFLRTDDDGKKAYQVTIDYQEDNPMGGVYLSGMDGSANWDFTIKNEKEIKGNPQLFDKNAWSYIWKENDWNQFRVRIENNPPTITTWINGFKVNEYTDTQERLAGEGKIGLQVHTGNDWEEGKVVRFRNIKIYPLTEGISEILKDTIAKLNFTLDATWDVDGWKSVYGSSSFPLYLGNGIALNLNGGNLFRGSNGEPSSTVVPDKVSETYNSLGNSDDTPVDILVSGLDNQEKYEFIIYSSRDDETANDDRTTTFSIEGTDKFASINPIGNTSQFIKLQEISPGSTGMMVRTRSPFRTYWFSL